MASTPTIGPVWSTAKISSKIFASLKVFKPWCFVLAASSRLPLRTSQLLCATWTFANSGSPSSTKWLRLMRLRILGSRRRFTFLDLRLAWLTVNSSWLWKNLTISPSRGWQRFTWSLLMTTDLKLKRASCELTATSWLWQWVQLAWTKKARIWPVWLSQQMWILRVWSQLSL